MIPSALKEVCHYLESCTGPVDLARLQKLLRETSITRHDLKDFCQFGTTTYQRNLIAKGDWYEMLCICWRAGHKSYIHDHHGSSCCFKIIEGHATEVVCEITGGSRNGQNLVRPVHIREFQPGDTCGSASFHIHEVINRSAFGEDLITVHIYSPPLSMRIYAYDEEPAVEGLLAVGAGV